MFKYRSLTTEELQGLEKEFVQYLVVNGITGDDWVKIKAEDLPKAEKFINLFSDVIFEGIFSKVRFLEYRSKKVFKTFQCLDQQLVMVAMEAAPDSEVDFTDPSFIARAVQDPPSDLRIYTTQKAYTNNREKELFELTESGCTLSDGKMFKALCMVL